MSSTYTTKHSENNNIDTIAENFERVVISDDKKDTDKECTSCEQNNITEGIEGVALKDTTSVCACASCGKKGDSDNMNTCNKCKMVKYCNAACKKKHRSKHKKACERRVAELHDEQLFKDHPPREECPICFLLLPVDIKQSPFMTCCGKTICRGCYYAMIKREKDGGGKADLCPYCRTSAKCSKEEGINRIKRLMDKGNATAFNTYGNFFAHGIEGMPQDWNKAIELYLKAGELGCAVAYYNLGVSYDNGHGVEIDKKKAKQYYELAAMGGDVNARHAIGCDEGRDGNHHRAMKHIIIAARAGFEMSLENVKRGYKYGLITKDDFANTLRAYQKRQDETKSDERDEITRLFAVAGDNPHMRQRFEGYNIF